MSSSRPRPLWAAASVQRHSPKSCQYLVKKNKAFLTGSGVLNGQHNVFELLTVGDGSGDDHLLDPFSTPFCLRGAAAAPQKCTSALLLISPSALILM